MRYPNIKELRATLDPRNNYSDLKKADKNTAEHMVNVLLRTFPLSPEMKKKICAHECRPEINDAMKSWLSSLLINPGQQFCYILMPLIAKRFDEYITQIRMHKKCL